MKRIYLAIILMLLPLVVSAGMMGELDKLGWPKPPETFYTVYETPAALPTFSIYSMNTKRRLFKGVTNIQSDARGCGFSFIHDGKRKWIKGDIWVEPEPPHGDIKVHSDIQVKKKGPRK